MFPYSYTEKLAKDYELLVSTFAYPYNKRSCYKCWTLNRDQRRFKLYTKLLR